MHRATPLTESPLALVERHGTGVPRALLTVQETGAAGPTAPERLIRTTAENSAGFEVTTGAGVRLMCRLVARAPEPPVVVVVVGTVVVVVCRGSRGRGRRGGRRRGRGRRSGRPAKIAHECRLAIGVGAFAEPARVVVPVGGLEHVVLRDPLRHVIDEGGIVTSPYFCTGL